MLPRKLYDIRKRALTIEPFSNDSWPASRTLNLESPLSLDISAEMHRTLHEREKQGRQIDSFVIVKVSNKNNLRLFLAIFFFLLNSNSSNERWV